jgi:hypothetical protein
MPRSDANCRIAARHKALRLIRVINSRVHWISHSCGRDARYAAAAGNVPGPPRAPPNNWVMARRLLAFFWRELCPLRMPRPATVAFRHRGLRAGCPGLGRAGLPFSIIVFFDGALQPHLADAARADQRSGALPILVARNVECFRSSPRGRVYGFRVNAAGRGEGNGRFSTGLPRRFIVSPPFPYRSSRRSWAEEPFRSPGLCVIRITFAAT